MPLMTGTIRNSLADKALAVSKSFSLRNPLILLYNHANGKMHAIDWLIKSIWNPACSTLSRMSDAEYRRQCCAA